ncbi:MAG TPA: hypothetical protein VGC84_06150, partial [Ilumatobacteraceae bacterium]
LGGDCKSNGGSYNHSSAKLPKVSLTLEDPSGATVDMQRDSTGSYDVDGFVGTAIRTVKIARAGTYHLNVESDETDFAVAIGKDPKKAMDRLTAIGGGVALAGIVVGLVLFLLGLRRRRLDPAVADNPAGSTTWPPYTVQPTGPPLPPMHPGFRPEPPTTVSVPGQPPVRLPDQPAGGGFAPPTFAPPSVWGQTAPTSPPPPPAPPSTGPVWSVPDDRETGAEDADDREPDDGEPDDHEQWRAPRDDA